MKKPRLNIKRKTPVRRKPIKKKPKVGWIGPKNPNGFHFG